MKKGALICFIGIDGSGKSTLAKALIGRMKRSEIEMKYVWCKFESLFLKFLITLKNMLLVNEKNWKRNYEESLRIKNGLLNRGLIAWIYEKFVIISYTFQIFYKISLPLKFGRNIVCDRFYFDSIVDLSMDLRYSNNKFLKILGYFTKWYPLPDVIFFIDVPEEVALKRKKDIPSCDFIKYKRYIYHKIAKLQKKESLFVALDGTQSIDKLRQ
jgi:dTMP kinase